MSKNPINLALIFCLEIANLVALGSWGWTEHDGILRWLLMLGLPAITAAIWGVFRVPGEPGDALVPISGRLRLVLEWSYFALGVILLSAAHHPTTAAILAALVVIHYLAAYDRVLRG